MPDGAVRLVYKVEASHGAVCTYLVRVGLKKQRCILFIKQREKGTEIQGPMM